MDFPPLWYHFLCFRSSYYQDLDKKSASILKILTLLLHRQNVSHFIFLHLSNQLTWGYHLLQLQSQKRSLERHSGSQRCDLKLLFQTKYKDATFLYLLADGFRLRSPVVVHSYYNENNSHGKVKLNGLIYGYLFKGSTKLVTTAPLVVGLTNVVFP